MMFYLKVTSVFLLVVLVSCGRPYSKPYLVQDLKKSAEIIHGTLADPKIAVSTVYLSGCTGVLVGSHTILTAAHCLWENRDNFASSSKAEMHSQSFQDIAHVPSSKTLSKFRYPDIALVKIKDPIPGKVPAPISSRLVQKNDVLVTAGFGRGTSNPYESPDQLEIRVISTTRRTLAQLYYFEPFALKKLARAYHHFIDSGAVFALPYKDQSFCFGDSGGPVWTMTAEGPMIVGVNSAAIPHSEGTRSCRSPGFDHGAYVQVITPVYPVIHWIKSTLQKWE